MTAVRDCCGIPREVVRRGRTARYNISIQQKVNFDDSDIVGGNSSDCRNSRNGSAAGRTCNRSCWRCRVERSRPKAVEIEGMDFLVRRAERNYRLVGTISYETWIPVRANAVVEVVIQAYKSRAAPGSGGIVGGIHFVPGECLVIDRMVSQPQCPIG